MVELFNLNRQAGVRYPRLDTVMMVEKFIKDYDGEFKKKRRNT